MSQPITIIYVPGLGDGYDPARKFGMWLWSLLPGISAQVISSHWRDDEGLETKLRRILKAAEESSKTREVVLVGESAGGSLALNAFSQSDAIKGVVTLCGKNLGADGVNPKYYQANPDFDASMKMVDSAHSQGGVDYTHVSVVYSQLDELIRPRDTLLRGAGAKKLWIPGHLVTILCVQLFGGLMIRRIARATAQ